MPSPSLVSFLCFGLGLAPIGCSSKTPAEQCSVNVPTSCSDPLLAYDSGVGAVLITSCSPCHAAGGVEANILLTDYTTVSKSLTSVAGQLESCAMPPAGAPPLSADDRQMIIDWIACGAAR